VVATEEVDVRRLETADEFRQAEDVQRRSWGMRGDADVVPLHLLLTAEKNGGLVLGAFDGPRMVGYLFGFLGRTANGDLKHCSHMLGVVPEYRGRGIGQLLKARQREHALDAGLDLITWTYDPLESRNAYLNIVKLGVICRTFLPDLYGQIRDDMNAGLPSDRFEVEWWIRTPRVASRVAGNETPSAVEASAGRAQGDAVLNVVNLNDAGLPVIESWRPPDGRRTLVEIPADFQKLRKADLSLARQWRDMTRAIFETCFAAGYTVVDFLSDERNGPRRSYYVLVREPEELADGAALHLSPADRAGIQTGMDLYNAGEYWACHEALEEVWLDARAEDKLFLQGLIQAAAAFHKYLVQANAVGAVKLLTRSLNKLMRYSDSYMGLDMEAFKRGLSTCWREVIELGQRHIDEFDSELVPRMQWRDEARGGSRHP
jgi:predicted GNAT superfamily acetyltransferase/predicted metal-dependent hydrolase